MLDTCLVSGKLRDPSGVVLANARVTFTLTSREKDGDILILPRPVVAQTDEAGNISVELWPNSLGNAGTAYVVQAATDGGYVQHPAWTAVVPDAETADITDISELVPPSSVNDALAAVVEARRWAAEPEDSVVEDGLYSARHYAAKAGAAAAVVAPVAGIVDEIQTVAGVAAQVVTVAENEEDIGTVAGISAQVQTVADEIAAIQTVAGAIAAVGTVATNIADVGTVATDIADVGTVASGMADVGSVAAGLTDVQTVAGSIANVNAVASSIAAVGTVATNIALIDSVNDEMADIQTVAGAIADVSTVAGAVADVSTVAADIADVSSVATNMTAVLAAEGHAQDASDFADAAAISAAESASHTSVRVSIYNEDGIDAGIYYADRAALAATRTRVYGEIIAGDPGAEVEFYIEVEGVFVAGPYVAEVGTPVSVSGISVAIDDGDRVNIAVASVIGAVTEFYGKLYGGSA